MDFSQEQRQVIRSVSEYVQALISQKPSRALYERYEPFISQVTPDIAFEVFYALYQDGIDLDQLLNVLEPVMNTFHKPLTEKEQVKPDDKSFIGLLAAENKALVEKINELKVFIQRQDDAAKTSLRKGLADLQAVNHHYLKKENILFPYLEKKAKRYQGLALMWALHDKARMLLKRTAEVYASPAASDKERFQLLGKLFFVLQGLVNKEDWILFPVAIKQCNDLEQIDMLRQCRDYEWTLIDPPDLEAVIRSVQHPAQAGQKKLDQKGQRLMSESQTGTSQPGTAVLDAKQDKHMYFQTETGKLSLAQVDQVFAALPVDLTVVDEQNRVCYFNRPKERVFPRSPAIIGRKVENCHPPQSVHKVMEIISAFREGRREKASFWINLHGQMVLIQYFALRDDTNQYRGTLEVSQDITGIQKLEGEQRLLSWPDDQP